MAAPTQERPKKYQCIANTPMKPVVLSFVTDHDIDPIAHGFNAVSLRKKRDERWVHEAFDQGALLTQLDLSILLGISDAVVSTYVNEIQSGGRHLLPTRGNVHDLSGAITHKTGDHHPVPGGTTHPRDRPHDAPQCRGRRPLHPRLPSCRASVETRHHRS